MGDVVDLSKRYNDQCLDQALHALVQGLHDDLVPFVGKKFFEMVALSMEYFVDHDPEIGVRALQTLRAYDAESETLAIAFSSNLDKVIFVKHVMPNTPVPDIELDEDYEPSIFMQIELRGLSASERLQWRGWETVDKDTIREHFQGPSLVEHSAGCLEEGTPNFYAPLLVTIPCRMMSFLVNSEHFVVTTFGIDEGTYGLVGVYTGGDRPLEVGIIADFKEIYKATTAFTERLTQWKVEQKLA